MFKKMGQMAISKRGIFSCCWFAAYLVFWAWIIWEMHGLNEMEIAENMLLNTYSMMMVLFTVLSVIVFFLLSFDDQQNRLLHLIFGGIVTLILVGFLWV
jgi:Mn2+/Fe2+ NRAMP family transporter